MIPQFSGPESIEVPHARFLYREYESIEDAWDKLMSTFFEVDDMIESHPRLEKANEHCFMVFFEGSSKVWVGREIIGHSSSWPNGLAVFDTYKGMAFEWKLLKPERLTEAFELTKCKEQLSSLAQGALAPTWKVKFSPMECLNLEKDDAVGKMPMISFQFFKSH